MFYTVCAVTCIQCWLYTMCAVYSVCSIQCAVTCIQCVLYTMCAVYSVCSIQCALYTVYVLYNVRCIQCMFYTMCAVTCIQCLLHTVFVLKKLDRTSVVYITQRVILGMSSSLVVGMRQLSAKGILKLRLLSDTCVLQ